MQISRAPNEPWCGDLKMCRSLAESQILLTFLPQLPPSFISYR